MGHYGGRSMSGAIEFNSRRSDLRVLWHLLFHRVRGETHTQRLESFYSGQAGDYDAFRSRMLHGRGELMSWLEFPPAGTWVDMGAGTGHNLFAVADRASCLDRIHLVDLSSSLLAVADERVRSAGMKNVSIEESDATLIDLPTASADIVTFSYSLTMIPDWFEAILQAERVLKPGGRIAVTDFYISRKHAEASHRQHGWLRRTFWSLWFAADNVFLSSDPLAMLHRHFKVERCDERLGSVPYMPLLRAPYYLFVGQKPLSSSTSHDEHDHVH